MESVIEISDLSLTFERDGVATRVLAGLGFTGERVTGGVVYRGNRFDYGLPAPAGAPSASMRRRNASSSRTRATRRTSSSISKGFTM